METLDDEKIILESYKRISSSDFFFNGSFFRCLRIKALTKSFLFSKSWIDSSSKNDFPPDFHNDKHRIMMEVMRVDDCVNEKDGKRVANSFQRANLKMKKMFGKNYKKEQNGTLFFIPDTRDNTEYNFEGYFNNFKRVMLNHSGKIKDYRKNYPLCKTCVLLICDESNNYVEVTDQNDLSRDNPLKPFKIHYWFLDKDFVDVIKGCNADYVIWMGYYKILYLNGKRIKMPRVCIYDVKNIKENGAEYNHSLMFKVIEEVKSI